MSYHGGSSARTSSTSNNRRTANRRAVVTTPVVIPPVAPPGYHYMPDGSLMLDSQMQAARAQQILPSELIPPMPIKAAGRIKTAPSQKNRKRLGLERSCYQLKVLLIQKQQ